MVNSRGDVVALFDSTGKELARYNYDAWGNCTVVSPTGTAITDANHIANVNPLRYRGYYLDTDTGLYYLQSRYYDPMTHRFLNADGQVNDGLAGSNMFAYCYNNPCILVDWDGKDPIPAWASRIVNGNGTSADFSKALSVNANSWSGYARTVVNNAISIAGKHNRPTVGGYEEHKKKGTTTPSNRPKHEEAESRRKRDQRGEKGDSRRRPNPNKRRPQNDSNVSIGEKVTGTLVVVGGAVAIIYLVANDATGIGALDDGAIAPLLPIIWDNAQKILA